LAPVQVGPGVDRQRASIRGINDFFGPAGQSFIDGLDGFERAGVRHPDLSAGNVLLDDGGEAWVVDLDRARTDAPSGSWPGSTMLARLERSVRKLTSGSPIPRDAWTALRAGFEEGP